MDLYKRSFAELLVMFIIEVACIAVMFMVAYACGMQDPPRYSPAYFFWCFVVGYTGLGLSKPINEAIIGDN